MPVVTVTLMEDTYDETTRANLARRLTGAVRATIDAPLDGITVMVHEVASANYMRGGVHRVPGAALPAPADLVRSYLDAAAAGETEKASGYLAEGFTMTFPGGVVFRTLEELREWSKPRYRLVRKTYERIDEAVAGPEGVVVYCFGTLSGEWPDGTSFSGIRFIDRITVAGGKLVDELVWNDLAEVRPTGQT